MLQTLDTGLAFLVILTVVSLLITIIVQMVSAALSLRGKNLANALALTFQTIDPKIGDQAHALAEHVLKDPILSDSLWRSKDRGQAAEHQSAPQTQGWGFWDVRRAWRLATAVRPGEIYRILHDLNAQGATAAGGAPAAGVAGTAAQLLAALQVPDATIQEARDKLAAVNTVANLFTTDEQKAAVLDALGGLGTSVERASTQAYDRFQRWFGTAQDRAEQWFQAHTRNVTIVASFAVAFTLQLDAVDILRRLRNDPKLVQALVELAPNLPPPGQTPGQPPAAGSNPANAAPAAPAASVTPEDYQKAFNDLRQKLDRTGFDLVPTPLFGRWDQDPVSRPLGHFVGMVLMAGLLTLGAPFWFNLLKNLMSLRPAVATLIERRPQSSPALPQSPANPLPPTS